jgi:hypothetical protein
VGKSAELLIIKAHGTLPLGFKGLMQELKQKL